ncbi:hypothetical protein GH733_004920, partial [Mirounga leonina]
SSCARVGHSCSYSPPVGDAKRGKVFIVGGADLSKSFSDVHTTGEHPPPPLRTFHTSSAAIRNQLYVFVGGERGAQPIQGEKLHVFDTDTLTWSQTDTWKTSIPLAWSCDGVSRGQSSSSTEAWQGTNSMIMSIALAVLRTQLRLWGNPCISSEGSTGYNVPLSHRKAPLDGPCLNLKIFYHLDVPVILCVIPQPVICTSEKEDSNSVTLNCDTKKGASTDKGVTQGGDSHEESQTATGLCFAFGGMNTEGEIYSDCIVTHHLIQVESDLLAKVGKGSAATYDNPLASSAGWMFSEAKLPLLSENDLDLSSKEPGSLLKSFPSSDVFNMVGRSALSAVGHREQCDWEEEVTIGLQVLVPGRGARFSACLSLRKRPELPHNEGCSANKVLQNPRMQEGRDDEGQGTAAHGAHQGEDQVQAGDKDGQGRYQSSIDSEALLTGGVGCVVCTNLDDVLGDDDQANQHTDVGQQREDGQDPEVPDEDQQHQEGQEGEHVESRVH